MSRREFQFSEGSSNKFWAITVEGKKFTVEFGRTGTKGQTQEKEFASEEAARQAADKLIDEKTKKGYTEVGAATSPLPTVKTTPAKAKTKPVAEPATAPPPTAPTALVVTRTIDLDPEDWHRATWRPRRRLEKPDGVSSLGPQPFLSLLRDDVTPEELLTVLGRDASAKSSWSAMTHTVLVAARYVFPYLPDGVLAELRQRLRTEFDPAKWPSDYYKRPAIEFFLGALCGMHAEVLAVVASWSDDFYGRQYWDDLYHMPQQMVFGLGDPYLVDQHMRRLKLRPRNGADIRAWLAHTELSGLDYIHSSIQAETNKNEAAGLFKAFALVKAPEAAPYMLDLKLNSKVPMLARQWLDENPGNAIAGLIPAAAERGKRAEAALDLLCTARRQGHAAFIEEQIKSAPAEVADKIRREVLEHVEVVHEPLDDATTPAWLQSAMQSAGGQLALSDAGRLLEFPAWIRLSDLLPLTAGDRRLNDTQVSAVLSALRKSQLGAPTPLVKAIKEHIDPAVRDAFAWKLFELWLSEGAPSKEKWALLAVGHLGGDASVLKLTPLVRAWPGESQHQRAVTGLECLRAIGSDTALMQLNGIAQKLKFQGLKKKAQEFMEAIAQDRGMSRAQLEDRIVPDLDLDERGTRVFDFGPRQFTVVLDPDLKPVIRDDAGKLKSDLPKPGAKDDTDKANAALADWKILKKQLRDIVKVQAYRLEQAMVTGRRWNIQEFEKLLVRHPLMINLVRRLVWGGYDKQGKLLRTFRVTDEQEYADKKEQRCTLDGVATVGIVHPLHLSEDERSTWGQVLGDYEIISPFPQLGRAVLLLESKEAEAREITRFETIKVPGVSVASFLEKAGWLRGPLQDHGDFHEYYKHFPSAEMTAVVEMEPGLWVSNIADPQEQRLPRCFFRQGLAVPDWYYNRKHDQDLILGKVDPVVISEVLADLTALASKGK
jgi:predicted DNA-binding WGR domain protein